MAKIYVEYTIVSTANFFLVAREKSNPLAIVYKSALLVPPHGQRNVTITPLNPVMHSVELWTSVNGVDLDLLRARCDIDASLSNTLAFNYIQFKVDRGQGAPVYDPAQDDTQYVNPDLDGKTYLVFKPGFGPLLWGQHIQQIEGGGFEFIDGQTFFSGEEYTITVNNLVQTSDNTSGKGYPDNVVSISEDTAFDTSHYGKLLEFEGAGDGNGLTTLTIANLSTIPENTVFGINTHNGSQRYAVLQLPVGAYCQVLGKQRNKVPVGQGENAWFIKKGSYLRVVQWEGDHRRLGERVFTDGIAPLNTLPETGGWYLKTAYPRIFEWYVLDLPPSSLGTGTQDTEPLTASKGKWIIGSTKFWVPDRRNVFDRNTDGTRVSGDYQDQMVGSHNHVLVVTAANTSQTDGGNGRFVGGSSGFEPVPMNPVTTNNNEGFETRPNNMATNVYRII